MNMANGTTTQDRKLSWKPRKSSKDVLPDAPVGEWEASVLKKCKVTVTQKGDPRILIPFRLDKAMEEENEKYQGATVTLAIIFFDEEDSEKVRGSNMMKGRLRALCEALDVNYDEVYPENIESEEDFRPLFDAIEGKKGFTLWTVHNKRTLESGEEVLDTEVRFSKPGRAQPQHADAEDEPRGGKGKGAGKRASARR